ncbi:MAG: DUF507 family protein [Nitrospirota bacterium]
MKLPKERVRFIANLIGNELISRGFIEPVIEKSILIERIEDIITDDLVIEDRLNEEVKNILTQYNNKIKTGEIDYRKMFLLIKNRLIKERGLIL